MPLSEKDGYKLTMRFQQNINRLVHAFIMTSLMGAVGKSCLFFFCLRSLHTARLRDGQRLWEPIPNRCWTGEEALSRHKSRRPHGDLLRRGPRPPRSLFGSRSPPRPPRKRFPPPHPPLFAPQNAAPTCGSLCRVCTGRAAPLRSRGWGGREGRERREPLLSHKP